MRNKKSVLMTLNHNCGYFSTVAGIAGNGLCMSSGKFRDRNFSVTTKFLSKDKRDLTTYFAITTSRCYLLFIFFCNYFKNISKKSLCM